MLIQCLDSAANLNICLHCLVLDGVYRRTDGDPVFVEVSAPSDEALQALLHKIIARLMKLLTHRGVLVEKAGWTYLADFVQLVKTQIDAWRGVARGANVEVVA